MIAIIDGDVLAYQACRPRNENTSVQEGDQIFITLDDHGKRVSQPFTKEQDTQYLKDSWDNFQLELEKMLDTLYCTDYLMAVKSGSSHRDLMYPIELNPEGTKATWGYKANRWKPKGEDNKFVPEIRKLAIFEGLAVPSIGREADDLIRIWAEEARRDGDEYIICSVDKDLKCIPGNHYLMHPNKRCTITVSEAEAERHYYEQLIKGDPTDNIPGVRGIGEKKAAGMLAGANTAEEFQEIVVGAYIAAYEDEWLSMFLSNAKMIHLQRHQHDYFKASEWPILRELEGFK